MEKQIKIRWVSAYERDRKRSNLVFEMIMLLSAWAHRELTNFKQTHSS